MASSIEIFAGLSALAAVIGAVATLITAYLALKKWKKQSSEK